MVEAKENDMLVLKCNLLDIWWAQLYCTNLTNKEFARETKIRCLNKFTFWFPVVLMHRLVV